MSLDKAVFQERLERLLTAWKEDEGGCWSAFTSIVISTGKRDSDVLQYLKSVAFHQWLFGVEVADITLIITPSAMQILTFDGKKANILGGLSEAAKAAGCPLTLIKIPKGGDPNPQCVESIEFARPQPDDLVGGLPKLKQSGPVCDAFAAALASQGVTLTDASLPLAILLVTHDQKAALQNARKSAFLTSSVMNNAIKTVEDYIDKRKTVKHSKVSETIQNIITDPGKHGIKLKKDLCEYAYLPVVASGGSFELRVGANTDDARLHDGVVMLHIGGKYTNECANICRTLFFHPTPQMEKIYNAVVAAQKAAIAALSPAQPLSAAHAAAVAALEAAGLPELVPKLQKNVGFGMGLELAERRLQLSSSNEIHPLQGMVFNVSVGLADIKNTEASDERDQTFSVQVADTVVIGPDSTETLTRFSNSDWGAVSYEIKDDEESGGDADEYDDDLGSPSGENGPDPNLGRGRRNAARAADTAEHAAAIAERKRKQDALSKKKNEETYKRLTAQAGNEETEDSRMRLVTQASCYKTPAAVPPQRNSLVTLDKSAEALLVPIMGVLVPMHILTVKAIQYSQDGEANDKVHSYVRIQFHCNATYEARQAHPKAAFIKELSFRSAKSDAAQKFVQEAQALRRQVMVKDKEAAERATLVKQEKLQRHANRSPLRLVDVWVFPTISSKRKTPGTLECHYNGFRYSMPGGESLEITFSNIRHAFVQEAEKELITLVHFSLKNPIMAGKKKTVNVQIYTEVMGDTAATVDGRRSAYDPDELEEEQRDRERRQKINHEFRRFTKKVQDQWDRDFSSLKLEWDSPFRDLAFQGNTGKSTVVLMPTVHCLVQLVEAPYTVVPLADVEIVNLERVGFNGKTFDLVIIFKDFAQDVLMIGSIPTQVLDDIKSWLNTQDIKFFESKLNLQWKQILKTIVADPDEFMQAGGWAGFLDADHSDGEGEEDEVSEEFQPSSEEDDDEEESDSDSGASVVNSSDEDDDGEEYSKDSEEEEGMDWDELEDEARRADKLRGDSGDEANDPRNNNTNGAQKRKRPPGGGSGGGGGGKSRGSAPIKRRR
eukprot:jgi/Ulvmu1/6689/UM030_0020.1